MAETFVYEKTVYLCDTNAEGNVYFACFFEWQGIAREEFFRRNVPNHMRILQSGVRLITVNAWMIYQNECHLFDNISIQVNTANLKRASLELMFTFTNNTTHKLVGHGGEKLAFASSEGQLLAVPNTILENARRFLIPSFLEHADLDLKVRNSMPGVSNIKLEKK